MNKTDIDPDTKQLLMLAGERILTQTVWGLSLEQKSSPIYREIGQQRYLSALRTGGVNEAEMTKTVFRADPFFLKSKLVKDAAIQGFHFQVLHGHFDIVSKIKTLMELGDDCIVSPNSSSEVADAVAK